MASTFKNAGMAVGLADTSAANLYTAGGAQTAVIHAVYITNKSNAYLHVTKKELRKEAEVEKISKIIYMKDFEFCKTDVRNT